MNLLINLSASLSGGLCLLGASLDGLKPEHAAMTAMAGAIVFMWRQHTTSLKEAKEEATKQYDDVVKRLDDCENDRSELRGMYRQLYREFKKLKGE